jgi:hypothetical protein
MLNTTSDLEVNEIKKNTELLTEIVSLDRDRVDKSSQERSTDRHREYYVPNITTDKFSLLFDPNTRSRQDRINSNRSVRVSDISKFTQISNLNTETHLETKMSNIRQSLERDIPRFINPPQEKINKPSKMSKWASDFDIQKSKTKFIPAEKENKVHFDTAVKPNEKQNLNVKYIDDKDDYIEVNETFNMDKNQRKPSKIVHQESSAEKDYLYIEDGKLNLN